MNRKDITVFILLLTLALISVLNFKVYGQDYDRPVLSSTIVSPSYVDLSSGGVTVTISIQASDASELTVTGGQGGYLNPYSNILNGNQSIGSFSLVNGDQRNGTYETKLFLDPSNVPSKTYSIRIYEGVWTDEGGLSSESLNIFNLQISNTYNTIYFENGICKCPGTTIGDTETIAGVIYTVVDNSTIKGIFHEI